VVPRFVAWGHFAFTTLSNFLEYLHV